MTTEGYSVEEVEDMGDAKCSCSNCGWTGIASDVTDIGDCALTPGYPSPVGRCTECDGLVYIDEPEGMMSYLDLATNHLKNFTVNLWAVATPYPVIATYTHGFFASVPEVDEEGFDLLDVPDDLKTVLKHARKIGVKIIRFDADADAIEGLPVYDWL